MFGFGVRGEGNGTEGDAMRKLRIALALAASVAMIVIGQRQQAGRRGLRTRRIETRGFDPENEALFI